MARKKEPEAQPVEVRPPEPEGSIAIPTRPPPLPKPPGDRAELERLEAIFKRGHREAVVALREIRERKLYRVRGYDTFDKYMAEVWDRTRQVGDLGDQHADRAN